MNKQSVRYILWILIFFLVFILFNTWENEKTLTDKLKSDSKSDYSSVVDFSSEVDDSILSENSKEISIDTSLVSAKIDLVGGDIVFLSLKKYAGAVKGSGDGIVVFEKSKDKSYFAQSGFFSGNISLDKINRYIYSSKYIDYSIEETDSNLLVNLEYELSDGIFINKVYTFRSYSYEIDVDFYIRNDSEKIYSGRIYGLIKQKRSIVKDSFFNASMRTYEGGAVYTESKPYKKIPFDDISSKDFSYIINGGWIAVLERYFLSSWIPDFSYDYIYTAEKKSDNLYVFKYISENEIVVFPGECKNFKSKLYVGPKVKDFLSKLYKGLDLSIDYGIFWPISSPIFLLLNKIFNLVQNWGVAIILVTFMMKLLFFHLSSISYRSMGNMKKLQPRLNLLKERYKDDKKQFGQAVMDLYKKEKVNPLSGCFPILIQIPVFISLYYVLLESVELRHAPFFLWITDLSSKDSYYILPVIMCLTMFVQQKLNPPVQDPLQAKIMMFMPFIFLLIFLQFPSGLILYWIVNNILSILQQWIIMKNVNIS